MSRPVVILSFILCYLWGGTAVNARTFVYLSIAGEEKIAVYVINQTFRRKTPLFNPSSLKSLGDNGELLHKSDVKVHGAPGSLVLSPDRKFLYASLRTQNKVGSFRVDPENGGLTPIGEFPVETNLVYVNTDHTGRFLFGAEYVSGKVIVCEITSDGKVGTPTQVLHKPINAHCLAVAPSGKFVFVPHTGPNRIDQFRWDATTNKLIENNPDHVAGAPGSGPRHLAFHPKLAMAYSADELGSSLSVWKFSTDQGTLERVQTVSTLPEGFKAGNTCADVKLTPSGEFVYVSNRGHDSLARYRVDPQTGLVTSLGQTPTEKTPRSFDISPDGNFVYSAGQGSGNLASYRLNPQSGQLQPLKTYNVGPNPSWVMTVTYP